MTADGAPPIAFDLFCADRVLRADAFEVGLASPDLSAVHIVDHESKLRARFLASAPFDDRGDDRGDLDDVELVGVSPVFEHGRGPLLLHALHPRISPPGPDAQALAGLVGTTSEEVTVQFKHVAFDTLARMIELAQLRPHSDVLDVGCGMGRTAFALANYLGADASYLGLDVNEELLNWARKNFAPCPGFTFQHIDAGNTYYNPEGSVESGAIEFPRADASIDVVILMSVFTHMDREGIQRYLHEIHRVLRPGGRCICTWMLLNDEVRASMETGRADFQLTHACMGGWARDPKVPEDLIGFEEAEVRSWIDDAMLETEAIVRGGWSRIPGASIRSGQDLILLRKKPA